jgi:hypothetical protein
VKSAVCFTNVFPTRYKAYGRKDYSSEAEERERETETECVLEGIIETKRKFFETEAHLNIV